MAASMCGARTGVAMMRIVLECDPWGGESAMIWGTLALNKLVGAVIFQIIGLGMFRDTLHTSWLPMACHFTRGILTSSINRTMQDCTACATQDFFRLKNINLMPHSACPLDLNPTEHLRDVIQGQLNHIQTQPHTAPYLAATITKIFGGI